MMYTSLVTGRKIELVEFTFGAWLRAKFMGVK
jgi:hypothetical protein